MSTDIKEDFLEVDQNIPGQNYVCLSFVSPEKILKEKEVFFNTSFGVQGGGFIIIETKLNFVEHFIKLTFFIEIIKKFRLEKLIKCLLIL